MSKWITISKAGNCRSKARIKETHVTTYLFNALDSFHVLPGHHGKRVLEQAAETFNSASYQTSDHVTSCLADYGPAKRRKICTR